MQDHQNPQLASVLLLLLNSWFIICELLVELYAVGCTRFFCFAFWKLRNRVLGVYYNV